MSTETVDLTNDEHAHRRAWLTFAAMETHRLIAKVEAAIFLTRLAGGTRRQTGPLRNHLYDLQWTAETIRRAVRLLSPRHR